MDHIQVLENFNLWRRGAETEQPNPAVIGKSIEWAIKVAKAAKKLRDAKGRYHSQKAAEKLFELFPYDS